MALQLVLEGDTLAIAGDLTVTEVEQHWPISDNWLSKNPLKLELSQLQQVDSAGLAWLIELESLQRQQQGPMQWLHCPLRLNKLMTLYGLTLAQQRLVARTQN